MLIVDSPAGAASGDYPIRVTARTGALVADTVLIVRVRTPELSLTLISAPTVVPIGGSGRYLFDTRSIDDPTQAVFVRAEGLPVGLSATVSPYPAIGTVAVDISAASTSNAFTAFIAIVASRDGVELRLPGGGGVTLTVGAPSTASIVFTPTAVTPVSGESVGYGLAANPSSLTVARGATGVVDITVTPKGGFVSPINVSLALPSGWSAVWSTIGPNLFRATISVPSGAATGSVPLVLNTSSGSLAASLTLNTTVS